MKIGCKRLRDGRYAAVGDEVSGERRPRGEGTEKPRPISAGRGQNVILALNCSLRGELAIAEKMPKVAKSILVPGAAK